jgi:uncharacterized damage-inducible protein DinB
LASSFRRGRPRRYDLEPPTGFARRDAARAVAALDELSARLFDLIADLPPTALRFSPLREGNTIGMLVLHMAAAEAHWIARVTGKPIPAALAERLAPGLQAARGELRRANPNRRALLQICRRVRRLTRRRLAALTALDREVPAGRMRVTARGVLAHLLWHWTYHTGQVGLLRRLWGARYRWTFGRRLTGGGTARP